MSRSGVATFDHFSFAQSEQGRCHTSQARKDLTLLLFSQACPLSRTFLRPSPDPDRHSGCSPPALDSPREHCCREPDLCKARNATPSPRGDRIRCRRSRNTTEFSAGLIALRSKTYSRSSTAPVPIESASSFCTAPELTRAERSSLDSERLEVEVATRLSFPECWQNPQELSVFLFAVVSSSAEVSVSVYIRPLWLFLSC